jgi:LytS/YehU family sensor histidine kinase
VRELYERDAALADRVLDDLIVYLRAALPHLRESLSTLGQEISLVRAYLDIMRVQRGERLQFMIDCSQDAAAVRVPAMLLLPLVEHALQRPSPTIDSPSEIRIAAAVVGGRLRLTLDDDGAAFGPEARTGSLRDLSERLQALYGDAMRFDLERVPSPGTRATLEIPHEPADSSDR